VPDRSEGGRRRPVRARRERRTREAKGFHVVQRMTMAQLAQLAGLDVSTVSRALRGDVRRVSATTIDRVQQLALRVGYLPDANAASLRSRRSYVIGMLVPDLTDVVLANLFEAVSNAADAEGYLAIVTSTRTVPERRRAAVHNLLSRRVDGVIVADATLQEAAPAALVESGAPFVMALRSGGPNPSVVADDVAGGRLAAEHLLDAGHRALCVLGGPRNVSTVKERIRGFVETCWRAGVAVAESAVRHGDFGVEAGYRSMLQLLEDGQRPSAVFAVNDYNAIGAARALQEYGAVVGRDVALVGYNDISIGRFLEIPLTTVRVDHGIMGREVVQLLLRRVNGEEAASVQLEPELVVRASSDVSSRRSRIADHRSRTARLADGPSSS
jgi:LacI family transcriptional regulator